MLRDTRMKPSTKPAANSGAATAANAYAVPALAPVQAGRDERPQLVEPDRRRDDQARRTARS